MNSYYIGVDLGQSQDYTAIAVLERAEVTGSWDAVQYAWRKEVLLQVRHVERVALGTPYQEVVERVVQVARSRKLQGERMVLVDATGVGRPVVDLLRRAGPEVRMHPVVVTGGDEERSTGGMHNVPKRDLIVGLQVLLQNGGLRIARGMAHGAELAQEMEGMEVRISKSGKEQFAAWTRGAHDDLVFAVALACWGEKKFGPRREEYWRNLFQAEAGKTMRRVMEGL